MPPNNSMQRTALRTVADAERLCGQKQGMKRPLVALILSVLVAACTRHVRIEPLGYVISDAFPAQKSAYAKYASATDSIARDTERGPWLVGYFKCDSDIRSIAASQEMHHLG